MLMALVYTMLKFSLKGTRVCVCNMIKTESTDKYLSNRITWQTDV